MHQLRIGCTQGVSLQRIPPWYASYATAPSALLHVADSQFSADPFAWAGLQDDREKDPAFVSDAYAECYPAFHDFGTTVVDSDEEDMSHMDKKMVRLWNVSID